MGITQYLYTIIDYQLFLFQVYVKFIDLVEFVKVEVSVIKYILFFKILVTIKIDFIKLVDIDKLFFAGYLLLINTFSWKMFKFWNILLLL